jgi:hypothetical protein
MMRNKHSDTLAALKSGELHDQITGTLEKVAADLVKSFATKPLKSQDRWAA